MMFAMAAVIAMAVSQQMSLVVRARAREACRACCFLWYGTQSHFVTPLTHSITPINPIINGCGLAKG